MTDLQRMEEAVKRVIAEYDTEYRKRQVDLPPVWWFRRLAWHLALANQDD